MSPVAGLMATTAVISCVGVLDMRELLSRTTIEESSDSGDVGQPIVV